jgi:exodeoxyribonuclease VII large subunit
MTSKFMPWRASLTTDKTLNACNLPILSVSGLSRALKGVIETGFSQVRVKGEISGFKRAASGHLYFSLKDEGAVLDGVCWRGAAARLGIAPGDGMEVVAAGRITTYAPRSRYQIVVETMEPAGEGALFKLIEERKRKLRAEGLFDEERKRKIPFLPGVIGVVTSPTGAVIRDILQRIDDRFPRPVLLWPVPVQGPAAADRIAAAIEGFNKLKPGGKAPRPDVIIVARGGGSLEDLMAFNEEAVVRAAAKSEIPLISAVGHETDTMLIDYAADRRVPTPTAAAEMAVPVRIDLLAQVMDDGGRMMAALRRRLDNAKRRLEDLCRGLPNLARIVDEATQRLDDWAERLNNSIEVALRDKASSLAHNGALLESFSYERVLERGFALVRDAAARPLRTIAALSPGQDIGLQFHDGAAAARVSGISANKTPPNQELKKKQSKKTDGRQGKLL